MSVKKKQQQKKQETLLLDLNVILFASILFLPWSFRFFLGSGHDTNRSNLVAADYHYHILILNSSLSISTILDTTTDGNTSPVGAVSPALLKSALVTHQRSQSLSGLQVNWLDQVTVFTFFYMYNVNESPSSPVG